MLGALEVCFTLYFKGMHKRYIYRENILPPLLFSPSSVIVLTLAHQRTLFLLERIVKTFTQHVYLYTRNNAKSLSFDFFTHCRRKVSKW